MASRRASGRPFPAARQDGTSSSNKGKGVAVEPLTQGLLNVDLGSEQDDGGWEVQARKSKNRAGSGSARQWGPPAHNSNPRAPGNVERVPRPGTWNHGGAGWGSGNPWQAQNAEFRRPAGRGNGRPQFGTIGPQSYNVSSNPLIRPPLENGWNWSSGTDYQESLSDDISQVIDETAPEFPVKNNDVDDEGEEGFDDLEDTDDDLMSDDYDSDTSQKSHDTRKKSRWFKKFFANLDSLTVEQINEPERQWHCPACQGGPGAIDWYKGLQPLMNHAKTKGSKRVKIHRELAEVLDEELRRRGTSAIPSGEMFGKWKGLKDEEKDHLIVWPPMVIIQNTQLEQDENEKWKGMGNQELLDYFSTYEAMKARHSYGPQGHRGMSVLIFENSGTGYFEAERLHKHFIDQGTGRDAWNGRRRLFLPGGQRQLYGYMAIKEDMDSFNRHSQGKSQLKYEMKSFREMVVSNIRKMGEDNQQLHYFKDKSVQKDQNIKALSESLGIVIDKLRKTEEENRIVRSRTKVQHQENKEEMYMQEEFFKDQMKIIHESRNEKVEGFERLQQEKREEVKQSSTRHLNAKEQRIKDAEFKKFVELQDKEMESYVVEEEKLRQAHEDNITAMRLRHWEEEMQLEKQFNEDLAKLMEKYSSSRA